jgi:hypothetical protein
MFMIRFTSLAVTESAMRERPKVMCGPYAFTAIAVDEHDLFTDSCVYIFGRAEPTGILALYAGQAKNAAKRLGPDHEHWNEAVRRGMNVILAHLLAETPHQRQIVEEFLIRTYDPPINKLKPTPDALDALHDIFASRFLPATPPFSPTPQNALLGLFAEAVAPTIPPPDNALIRALLEPPPPPPNPFLSLFTEAVAPPEPSMSALVRALLEPPQPPLSPFSNVLGNALRRPKLNPIGTASQR